jgi:hypothetical protein
METIRRLEDYFEGFELAEYLEISTFELVGAFEELVEANLDDLEELMGVMKDEREEEDG